jgi:mRNA interferase RelE/StbE
MNRRLTPAAVRSYTRAPASVQKAFDKQARLLGDLRHPSLRAKKYGKAEDIWQARVTRDWRFYFTIEGNTGMILDILPHPK